MTAGLVGTIHELTALRVGLLGVPNTGGDDLGPNAVFRMACDAAVRGADGLGKEIPAPLVVSSLCEQRASDYGLNLTVDQLMAILDAPFIETMPRRGAEPAQCLVRPSAFEGAEVFFDDWLLSGSAADVTFAGIEIIRLAEQAGAMGHRRRESLFEAKRREVEVFCKTLDWLVACRDEGFTVSHDDLARQLKSDGQAHFPGFVKEWYGTEIADMRSDELRRVRSEILDERQTIMRKAHTGRPATGRNFRAFVRLHLHPTYCRLFDAPRGFTHASKVSGPAGPFIRFSEAFLAAIDWTHSVGTIANAITT